MVIGVNQKRSDSAEWGALTCAIQFQAWIQMCLDYCSRSSVRGEFIPESEWEQ